MQRRPPASTPFAYTSASGARAPIYGTTIDHVLALDIVTPDGRISQIRAGSDALTEYGAVVDGLVAKHADAVLPVEAGLRPSDVVRQQEVDLAFVCVREGECRAPVRGLGAADFEVAPRALEAELAHEFPAAALVRDDAGLGAPLAALMMDDPAPYLQQADELSRALEAHAWPGNVREMENLIKRATIMADGSQITAADLGLDNGHVEQQPFNLRQARENAERLAVSRAPAPERAARASGAPPPAPARAARPPESSS